MPRLPRFVAALLTGVVLAGCGIPRDPHGTLERVRGDTLQVGITEAPPFVVRHGEEAEPGGVEAALIRAFADSLGAAVRWHWGPMDEHLEALRQGRLDLAAGGLTTATPWNKHVGLTRPYFTAHDAVGGRPGTAAPDRWQGVPVAVEAGSALAARLAGLDARVVETANPERYAGFVAAPEWELRAWGRVPVKWLRPTAHVLAVQPGENGFLYALEGFLDVRRGALGAAFVEAAG